tara:strand:+ start:1090 stop:1647 length:558 start_codon:yes stop_codon:yes gene_type:complete
MAEKGDEAALKEDFFDAFLPDGITIYVTDEEGNPTDERDTAAESEAEDSVKNITDAMADAVSNYVDGTLEANNYKTESDIEDMIGDAAGSGDSIIIEVDAGRSSLNEKLQRIDDIQHWTQQTFKFFGRGSGVVGSTWIATTVEGDGYFDYLRGLRESGVFPSGEDMRDIQDAWDENLGDWPDVDI